MLSVKKWGLIKFLNFNHTVMSDVVLAISVSFSSHSRLHLVLEIWKVGPLVVVRFHGLPAAQIFLLIILRYQLCMVFGMVNLDSMSI
jgi:hypothetical protein